jgi:hypothetical protein
VSHGGKNLFSDYRIPFDGSIGPIGPMNPTKSGAQPRISGIVGGPMGGVKQPDFACCRAVYYLILIAGRTGGISPTATHMNQGFSPDPHQLGFRCDYPVFI